MFKRLTRDEMIGNVAKRYGLEAEETLDFAIMCEDITLSDIEIDWIYQALIPSYNNAIA